jgi:hypothetical protein
LTDDTEATLKGKATANQVIEKMGLPPIHRDDTDRKRQGKIGASVGGGGNLVIVNPKELTFTVETGCQEGSQSQAIAGSDPRTPGRN